jgi:hypothetical protein
MKGIEEQKINSLKRRESKLIEDVDVGPSMTEIEQAHQDLDKFPYYESLSQILEKETENK